MGLLFRSFKKSGAEVEIRTGNRPGQSLGPACRRIYTTMVWRCGCHYPDAFSRRREHTRGYNQSALFAKPAARALGIPYLPDAVVRTRETISQVGLTAEERKTNLAGAFLGDGNQVADLSILLLDDITTTGSTLNECAKALK